MNIVRQEIRTGLLVLFSLTLLVGTLLYLGAPGVFVPMKTYWVYAQNASGIKLGADVLLAGRRIGQVRRLLTPVAEADRPDNEKKMEACLEIRVERTAAIYNDAQVSITQSNLLSDMLLDFSGGTERSGLAPSGRKFLATKVPGVAEGIPQMLNELHPAILEATKALETLQKTAESVSQLVGPDGEARVAIQEFHRLGVNMNSLTGPQSSLQHSLTNLEAMTDDEGTLGRSLENIKELTAPDGALAHTLRNAEKFTHDLSTNRDIYAALRNLKLGSARLDLEVGELGGKFSTIGNNLEQASDTIKRQPWRLIYPVTKKYPPAPAGKAEPERRGRESQR